MRNFPVLHLTIMTNIHLALRPNCSAQTHKQFHRRKGICNQDNESSVNVAAYIMIIHVL